MELFSGYSEESLSDVIKEVKSFCMEINPKFISTLKYKFNKAEYGEVAKHQFKFWYKEFLWKKVIVRSLNSSEEAFWYGNCLEMRL